MQEVTKRCRLSWLTNSALAYEPKYERRGGGLWVLSQWLHVDSAYARKNSPEDPLTYHWLMKQRRKRFYRNRTSKSKENAFKLDQTLNLSNSFYFNQDLIQKPFPLLQSQQRKMVKTSNSWAKTKKSIRSFFRILLLGPDLAQKIP